MRLNDLFLKIRYPDLVESYRIFSHLTFKERAVLMKLASEKSVHNVVEIGSYLGASATAFATGFARQGKTGTIYCIDTWNNDAMAEGNRNTMEEFTKNSLKFSRFIRPIRGWSTNPEVVQRVAASAKRIDLLFLDGDHSYEATLADWKAYSPLLGNGAIVAMHDVGWAEGVLRVLNDEIKPAVVKEGHLPNLWWGCLER